MGNTLYHSPTVKETPLGGNINNWWNNKSSIFCIEGETAHFMQ
jgi:hypothetical protein